MTTRLPTVGTATPATASTATKLLAEGLIDLAEAAACFADARGRKPHVATLRRWAKTGCRGHKLETTLLGNRLMTSRQATVRFLAALNGGEAVPSQHTPDTRAEKAGDQLAAAGL
jgi:hypothetical protein